MAAALRMLARRSLSEGEILARLEAKGFPGPVAVAALDRLRELGLVDDGALCAQLARTYRESRGYGPVKIAWTLKGRAFPADLVEAVLRETSEDEVQDAAARALRRRFRSGIPPGREGAAKAYRFLAGRGFPPEACRRAIGRRLQDIQKGEVQ